MDPAGAGRPRTRVIIGADDFGLSEPVNEGIERAHREGFLSAASLMVAGAAVGDAVRRARRNPGLRVGLHLVVVEGPSVLPHGEIPRLVGADAQFGSDQVRRGMRYFLDPRVRRELASEIRAQFDAFAATGLPLDHANAHKHMHLHPTVGRELIEIGRAYGLRAVRVPTEPAGPLLACGTRPTFAAAALRAWTRQLRAAVLRTGLATTDQCFGIAWSGAMSSARVSRLLDALPPGVSEIYFHPAVGRDPLLGRLMPGYDHDGELATLRDPDLAERIAPMATDWISLSTGVACERREQRRVRTRRVPMPAGPAQETSMIDTTAAGSSSLGDRTVNRMGYGAMQLAGPGVFGPPKDHAAALDVLREAVTRGVDHIDTSDFYGPHVTNQLIREALAPYPDDLVIVTKIGARRGDDRSWHPAFSPDELRQAVHDNLRNLGLDALDVVNLRIMFDRHGPAEGSIEVPLTALVELQREGLVRHIGLSNVTAAQVAEGRRICDIVCVQNHYNLAHRVDDALIDELARDGIAYVPFFPLGGFSPLQSSTLSDVAAGLGATPMQVALAWLLRRAPNILLIPGTSSVAHLHENLEAAELVLSDEVLARLDAIGGSDDVQ